jgi:hypothetical protein
MDKPRHSTMRVVALLSIGVGAGLVPASAARAQNPSATSKPVACGSGEAAAKDGSCTKHGVKNGVEVGSFNYGVKAPLDTHTPGVTGKSPHNPVVVTKGNGAASPELLSASATNEAIKTVPGATNPKPTPKPCKNSKVPTAQAQCPPPKPKKG